MSASLHEQSKCSDTMEDTPPSRLERARPRRRRHHHSSRHTKGAGHFAVVIALMMCASVSAFGPYRSGVRRYQSRTGSPCRWVSVAVQSSSDAVDSERSADNMDVATSVSTASFGDVVGLRPQQAPTEARTTEPTAVSDLMTAALAIRRRNTMAAVVGLVLALSQWLWQWTHPVEPIQILVELQRSSAPITCIGRNDKPTVVDFWAPWCDNCKLAAPTLRQLERDYGNDVNFVLVNGDLASSWPLIEAFRVDAIPHLALVGADGTVETALIGPIPKRVLAADLDVLIANSRLAAIASSATPTIETNDVQAELEVPVRQELPFKMLDVFAGQPDSARRLRFGDD